MERAESRRERTRPTRLSMAVWVRKARPMACIVGWTVFVLYRMSWFSHDTSLLVDLTKILGRIHDYLDLATSSSSITANLPWLLSRLLQSALKWMADILAVLAVRALFRWIYILYHFNWKYDWKPTFTEAAFDWLQQNVKAVQNELQKQEDEIRDKAEQFLHKPPNRFLTLEIPQQGRPAATIIDELKGPSKQENERTFEGKLSGTVYQGSPEHNELMTQVFGLYAWSNPLHPGIWPKLNQCEAEVIYMTSALLHGPTAPSAYGCVTSGGTESILLAIRAHLNCYGKQRGIQYPELICGSTAHAAVDKACEIFGIRKVVIDCQEQCARRHYQLDPKQVQRRITSNTIMIYASAPCYPQGVVDPIQELSDLARKYDIGLHVDACLGGFVLAFLPDGEVPPFDFRNPGVTSMSADTHKYGYASKGTSVVLYRTKQLRHGQYFCYADWTGGMYATPTLAGSRPGALAVCAWAALVSIGYDGYQARAQSIVQAARAIADGIRYNCHLAQDLHVLTPPSQQYMVVCIGSHTLNIYSVLDQMSELGGWGLVSLQSPACMHISVTLNVVPRVKDFLQDLHKAVQNVRRQEQEQKMQGNDYKKKKNQGTAGIYGTAGSVPSGAVNATLKAFTDMTLSP